MSADEKLHLEPEWSAVWAVMGEITRGDWSPERVRVTNALYVLVGHFRRDTPDAVPVFIPASEDQ